MMCLKRRHNGSIVIHVTRAPRCRCGVSTFYLSMTYFVFGRGRQSVQCGRENYQTKCKEVNVIKLKDGGAEENELGPVFTFTARFVSILNTKRWKTGTEYYLQ